MNLLIVGAGGHGRCCLDIARDMNKYDRITFLDDGHVGEVINDCQVIGSIDEMASYYIEYEHIFIAVGNNKLRKKLVEKAMSIGYTVDTLMSPHSYISSYAVIEEGSVIFSHAVIEANAFIGKGCIITSNTTVNHDAHIDDYCLIYSNSVIRPDTHIGEMTRIGSQCLISFGTSILPHSDIKKGEGV